MTRTNWDEVRAKFVDEHLDLFTGKNKKEQPRSRYQRLLELINDWDYEQRMLLAYEIRYELELNGLNELHRLPNCGIALNWYKPPPKFATFEDAFQAMRKRIAEEHGDEYAEEYVNAHKKMEWRVLSIEHGLFGYYINGDFGGCIQIGNNEEIYTNESIYKRIERDECPLVISG